MPSLAADGMPRALILYATREGQTGKVAVRIAERLRALGVDAQVVNAGHVSEAQSVDLAGFDLLVFGASMHAGGLERELIEFMDTHAALIESKPRAFFLVLLSAAASEHSLREQWLADARRKLDEQLAVKFVDVEMIAGALRYSKYSRPLKWMMRRIARQAGEDTDTAKDYEYTDWQQVERYADGLARSCRARAQDDDLESMVPP